MRREIRRPSALITCMDAIVIMVEAVMGECAWKAWLIWQSEAGSRRWRGRDLNKVRDAAVVAALVCWVEDEDVDDWSREGWGTDSWRCA